MNYVHSSPVSVVEYFIQNKTIIDYVNVIDTKEEV